MKNFEKLNEKEMSSVNGGKFWGSDREGERAWSNGTDCGVKYTKTYYIFGIKVQSKEVVEKCE